MRQKSDHNGVGSTMPRALGDASTASYAGGGVERPVGISLAHWGRVRIRSSARRGGDVSAGLDNAIELGRSNDI